MRYQKVEVNTWNDEKFSLLSQDGKLMFLYFLTCPHSNSIGAYVVKKGYISDDLRWNPKKVNDVLSELQKIGLVRYDNMFSVVVVMNYLKHNTIENPNQCKNAVKTFMSLPKTELLLDVKNSLETVSKHFKIPFVYRFETIINYVSVSVSDSVSVSEEGGAGGNEQQAPEEPKYTFENFWRDYPRKKAKGDAEKAWAKIKPGEHLAEIIRQAVQRATTSVDWAKDGGQYIPYPATWLNRKGWEDEYVEAGTVGTSSQSSSEDAEIIRLFNEAQRKKKEAMSAKQSG